MGFHGYFTPLMARRFRADAGIKIKICVGHDSPNHCSTRRPASIEPQRGTEALRLSRLVG